MEVLPALPRLRFVCEDIEGVRGGERSIIGGRRRKKSMEGEGRDE